MLALGTGAHWCTEHAWSPATDAFFVFGAVVLVLPYLKGLGSWDNEFKRGLDNVVTVQTDTASSESALKRRVGMLYPVSYFVVSKISAIFLHPDCISTIWKSDSDGMHPSISHVPPRNASCCLHLKERHSARKTYHVRTHRTATRP